MSEKEIQTNSRINSKSIALILLMVMGAGILILLQTKDSINQSDQPRLEKGQAAPQFSLPDLDGNMINLADYRGKVVFLNIWATWCPPCVEEMPSMEKLHQELKGEDFAILAVSIDVVGVPAVRPFMQEHKLSFTALTDAEGTLKSLYRTTGVPESFILDQNGVIVEKVIGPRNWATPEAIGFFRNLIRKE